MIYKKEKEAGFTVVEMIAVFFIIGVLLSLVFLNYNQNQTKIILDSAAYKLAADIRGQESKAGIDDTNCSSKTNYKYSYGIDFKISDSGKYYLFSDCNGDGANSSPDNVITVSLPKEVEISSISQTPEMNISFYPPGPSILVNNASDFGSASITIRLKSNPLTQKIININTIGMIDIN